MEFGFGNPLVIFGKRLVIFGNPLVNQWYLIDWYLKIF